EGLLGSSARVRLSLSTTSLGWPGAGVPSFRSAEEREDGSPELDSEVDSMIRHERETRSNARKCRSWRRRSDRDGTSRAAKLAQECRHPDCWSANRQLPSYRRNEFCGTCERRFPYSRFRS